MRAVCYPVRNPGLSPQNNTNSQVWPTSPGYPNGRTVWAPGIWRLSDKKQAPCGPRSEAGKETEGRRKEERDEGEETENKEMQKKGIQEREAGMCRNCELMRSAQSSTQMKACLGGLSPQPSSQEEAL